MNRQILRILCFAIFAATLGQGLVVPLLPGYANDLGASSLYIGFVFGAFCISRTLFLPLSGRLSDKKGRKPFIDLGLFTYSAASVAFTFSDGVAGLLVIRFLQGIASAMIRQIAQGYAGEITPPGREGFVMGLLNTSMCAGLSAGPILGGVVKDAFGMAAAVLSMDLVCFAGFLLSILFLPPA
ncbi:MAG: MFS transporter, partial [Desulfobacterales bacterium]|nr:MFS transporter [Desulfobacterales bacterium]